MCTRIFVCTENAFRRSRVGRLVGCRGTIGRLRPDAALGWSAIMCKRPTEEITAGRSRGRGVGTRPMTTVDTACLRPISQPRLPYRLDISRRKGASPIRVLIEATFPSADSKQKSRWVRALQYASSEGASADELRSFFRSRLGVAGCAHLAAKHQPKQNRLRDAWAD
jgi:hypothetical protein